jgi:ABC-type transport system involved in multi-copper enzyme maturation permease subunit
MSAPSEITVGAPAPPPPLAARHVPVPSWSKTLRGLWILTWRSYTALRRLPGLALILLLIPVLAYFTVKPQSAEPYFPWVIDFYFLLLLPLYCLSVCGGMIREDVHADTLCFLLTRPISRATLYLTKFLCQILWLQLLGLVSALLLFSVGVIRQIPEVTSVWGVLLATQTLAIVAYGALSALLGLLHQRYMVMGIVYGFVVELGIGRIPTNINNLSLSRQFTRLLAHSEALRPYYDWPIEGIWLPIVIPIAATAVFLGLGAAIFSFREYHHSEEMQK